MLANRMTDQEKDHAMDGIERERTQLIQAASGGLLFTVTFLLPRWPDRDPTQMFTGFTVVTLDGGELWGTRADREEVKLASYDPEEGEWELEPRTGKWYGTVSIALD